MEYQEPIDAAVVIEKIIFLEFVGLERNRNKERKRAYSDVKATALSSKGSEDDEVEV